MAHKFHGDWTCFTMAAISGSSLSEPRKLELKKASGSSGNIDIGSKLDGTDITGEVTGTTFLFTEPLSANENRIYKGDLIFEKDDTAGVTRMIIAGFFEPEDELKRAKDSQDEGTWIIIK